MKNRAGSGKEILPFLSDAFVEKKDPSRIWGCKTPCSECALSRRACRRGKLCFNLSAEKVLYQIEGGKNLSEFTASAVKASVL